MGGGAEVGMVQEGAAWARASAGFRLLGRGGLPSSFGPTACTELGSLGGVASRRAWPREVVCPKMKFRGGG